MVDINKHLLVPKHSKLTDAEKKKLFEKYSVSTIELPKIMKTDPAIKKFDPKVGDIILVERESKTAGKTSFYRAVVEG